MIKRAKSVTYIFHIFDAIMTTVFTSKQFSLCCFVLLCLHFIVIVSNAESQQHHHRQQRQPYGGDTVDSQDADDATNDVSPYQRSSYRGRDTARRQFNENDVNYQFGNRQLATSGAEQLSRRQLRKQQQRLEKLARNQVPSIEMTSEGNKCHIWVP